MQNPLLPLALCLVTFASVARAAEAVTYENDIRPIVETQCLGCHGPDSPEYPAFKKDKEAWLARDKGPRMDTYVHLIYFTAWPDTGALMRRLDDGKASPNGKPGNMYEHLGATESERQENLRRLKDWVGNWTLKRWADITKEDLAAITVRY